MVDFHESTIDFHESTIDFHESTIDFHKLNIVGNGIIRQSTLIRGFFKNTLKRRQKGQFFVLGGFSVMGNTNPKEFFNFDFRIPIYCIDPDSG